MVVFLLPFGFIPIVYFVVVFYEGFTLISTGSIFSTRVVVTRASYLHTGENGGRCSCAHVLFSPLPVDTGISMKIEFGYSACLEGVRSTLDRGGDRSPSFPCKMQKKASNFWRVQPELPAREIRKSYHFQHVIYTWRYFWKGFR